MIVNALVGRLLKMRGRGSLMVDRRACRAERGSARCQWGAGGVALCSWVCALNPVRALRSVCSCSSPAASMLYPASSSTSSGCSVASPHASATAAYNCLRGGQGHEHKFWSTAAGRSGGTRGGGARRGTSPNGRSLGQLKPKLHGLGRAVHPQRRDQQRARLCRGQRQRQVPARHARRAAAE